MNKKALWFIIIVTLILLGIGILWLADIPQETNNNSEESSQSSSINIERNIKMYQKGPDVIIDIRKKYTATMETTKGTMVFDLFANQTPVTVNSFVFLSRDNFYNDTVFHRIIQDFMIQGGDPNGTGTGGPGYEFDDEPITREYTRGTLAMANSGKNTNGSQFFIMTQDTPSLPKDYVIFGKLTQGFDVLDKIAATPVKANEYGEMSDPIETVSIKKITITEQ